MRSAMLTARIKVLHIAGEISKFYAKRIPFDTQSYLSAYSLLVDEDADEPDYIIYKIRYMVFIKQVQAIKIDSKKRDYLEEFYESKTKNRTT